MLAACGEVLPPCDAGNVLTAVRSMLPRDDYLRQTSRLPAYRRDNMVATGTTLLESAVFDQVRNDVPATTPERRACVAMLRVAASRNAVAGSSPTAEPDWNRYLSEAPEPPLATTIPVRYTIAKGHGSDGIAPGIRVTEFGTHGLGMSELLALAIRLDTLSRVSSAAPIFLGSWQGNFSCSGKVTAAFPGYVAPADWVADYQETVEFRISSPFRLPTIRLQNIRPSRPVVWTPIPVRPELRASIPYFDELIRVTDGRSAPNAIHFATDSESDLKIELTGHVLGNQLEARGIAELGLGVLLSRKNCSLQMRRGPG